MSAHPTASGMIRRRLLRAGALAGLAAVLPAGAKPAPAQCGSWPLWNAFVSRHIQPDGRVVDYLNADQRSTSEGQSYALFFALVANDQVLFDKVLGWTRHNLCGGRPDLNLPAWLWGRDEGGNWRVLDPNTASDGELWIAYALLEAGRLWNRPGYVKAGQQILQLMRAQEVATLPGIGPMLLPGRSGFADNGRWTLNPSYLPIQLLRRCVVADPKGPWAAIAANSARVLRESAPVGFARTGRCGTAPASAPIPSAALSAAMTPSACICGPACSMLANRCAPGCCRTCPARPTCWQQAPVSPKDRHRTRRGHRPGAGGVFRCAAAVPECPGPARIAQGAGAAHSRRRPACGRRPAVLRTHAGPVWTGLA